MDDAQFAPLGSILMTVSLLLLGAFVLFLGVLSWRGGAERNFATADRQDLRSVIWTSAETWEASQRANGPWLVTAAAGLLIAGVFSIVAIFVQGSGDAVGAILAVTCVALLWTVVFCTIAGVRGRVAARRVLDR